MPKRSPQEELEEGLMEASLRGERRKRRRRRRTLESRVMSAALQQPSEVVRTNSTARQANRLRERVFLALHRALGSGLRGTFLASGHWAHGCWAALEHLATC